MDIKPGDWLKSEYYFEGEPVLAVFCFYGGLWLLAVPKPEGLPWNARTDAAPHLREYYCSDPLIKLQFNSWVTNVWTGKYFKIPGYF